MRTLCATMVLLLLAAPGAADRAVQMATALQRAEQELARVVIEQPVLDSGKRNLGAWLKQHPDLRAQVECARACAFISADRVLEDGGLELDLTLPVRWLPGAVIAQLDDPGRYLAATGTAPRGAGRGKGLTNEEYWSRRIAKTTTYTAFRFTGMTREEAEFDAFVRSRGEALDLFGRGLPSLALPDGRTLRAAVPAATDRIPLRGPASRPLRRTYSFVDRAEGSVEVDYELPLLPLARQLSLVAETVAPKVPEAARAAARAAARRDCADRFALWAARDETARKWLEDQGLRLLTETQAAPLPGRKIFVVEMEIPQKEIPEDINKRLYADSWFPLVCRGCATW